MELEQLIRDCLEEEDGRVKIKAIIDQLCRDFAYAIHHPNARNGGLIGLAAAAIALGQTEVVEYLEDIVHPVLACFGDQDARVRYYACESMYNIAKVAKGEILVYFNELFDALSKLSADADPSVQNGADLLNRLIKDIVAEKAATYVSIINEGPPESIPAQLDSSDPSAPVIANEPPQSETTFSLSRFIPLLMERIYVINPSTRTFLVSWITLLDSIPDLELVSYIPSFLGGLINFLNDSVSGVRVATHACLDIFLEEIRHITEVKRMIEQQMSTSYAVSDQSDEEDTSASNNTAGTTRIRRQSSAKKIPQSNKRRRSSGNSKNELKLTDLESGDKEVPEIRIQNPTFQQPDENAVESEGSDSDRDNSDKGSEAGGDEEDELEGIYIPEQDVYIDFERIIEILISHLDSSVEEIQLVVLNWIETFLDIAPLSVFPFVPRFLSVLLPIMAYDGAELRKAAEAVNRKLLDLIISLPEENREVLFDMSKPAVPGGEDGYFPHVLESPSKDKLDYSATVNSLTLHFLDEKEETRVAALDWLIMLHRKVPKRILAINDGTFPALLKTLSDPSEQVITRDLQLLAQISFKSDDEYFTVFMVNLLNLFSTDRRLLETRGNLIIRQLCVSLKPERIYWTLAEILEQEDEDLEFASIMVQNLSNILITAPELSQLRMRLRSLNNKEGVLFFSALFRSWSHNPCAALALCLLSQAYEHAFLLLQTIVDFEITVALLIQIDKLVQLIESPVFTHLRLQLLEPEKFPYLYKCLYGILMLLPQSSAFATLRNRLNSVSSIGFLHFPVPSQQQQTRANGSASSSTNGSGSGNVVSRYSASINMNSSNSTPISFYDVRWTDLMKKFHAVQKRHQDARNSVLTRSFADVKIQEPSSNVPDSKNAGKRAAPAAPPAGSSKGISPVAPTTTTASQHLVAVSASPGSAPSPVRQGVRRMLGTQKPATPPPRPHKPSRLSVQTQDL